MDAYEGTGATNVHFNHFDSLDSMNSAIEKQKKKETLHKFHSNMHNKDSEINVNPLIKEELLLLENLPKNDVFFYE